MTRRRADPVANRDLISSYVWGIIESEFDEVVERALRSSAEPPLTYIGTGMTAIVFCDAPGMAYKVARGGPDERLRDEAEWLYAASGSSIRDHVAGLFAYDADNDVILRECVTGAPGTWYKHGVVLRDLHDQIGQAMLPLGWTAPEFKEDSYVLSEAGPILVDASMAHRVGQRLLRYIEEVLAGRRRRKKSESDETLAFDVRMEIDRSLTAAEAAPILARLARG